VRKQFKFNAAPKVVLPRGRDILGNGGIVKTILRPGNSVSGRPPTDALVKIHYTGWLMDGTRFDSSRDRFGQPLFKLGAGMERPVLEEGVKTMNRGELAEFVCTAQYAYGTKGWSGGSGGASVPPRATIRWEVELFGWSGFTGDQSKMSDAEMMDQAYHLKAQGTQYFKMSLWEEAAERYHEAAQIIDHPRFNVLEQLPTGWAKEAQKLLLSCQLNEAQCELKREEWNSAIALCEKVIERPSLLTKGQLVKAHYRRHQARFAKQEYDEALEDLNRALEVDPGNSEVSIALTGVRWARKMANRAQIAEFSGMFTTKGAKSTELYKEEMGIPPWLGPLPTAWLDVSVDGRVLGRIVIELNARQAPRTCENFRCLCTGERGNGKLSSRPLHYRGVCFHRIIRGFMVQTGDIVSNDGMGGESIFGGQFDDEYLDGKHDEPGVVAMANAGKNMNGSQFFITTVAAAHLDKGHVAFGRVVSGMDVVRKVERLPVNSRDMPRQSVLIDDCGSDSEPIPHVPVPFSQHTDQQRMHVQQQRQAKERVERGLPPTKTEPLQIPSSDSEEDDEDDEPIKDITSSYLPPPKKEAPKKEPLPIPSSDSEDEAIVDITPPEPYQDPRELEK